MGTNVAGTWDKAAKLLQECSTKQPGSAEANAALRTLRHLVDKVCELPPPPKAVWKKLVQQLKVPLQLGAAFSAAAQHSWKSPCTHCALITLQSLIDSANEAGVTKGAGSSSLASSIRQQLEQPGMLQQLAAVMTAAAADLQEQAAAHAAGALGKEQARSTGQGVNRAAMSVYDLMLGLWAPQSPVVDLIAWLCHPSGHAAAGMQLNTAVLRHASILAQHLLPQLRQHLPQEAEELLSVLQSNTRTARALGMHIIVRVVPALGCWQEQGEGSEGQGLQQLMLSYERLPYLATMVVLLAADVSRGVAAHNAVGASSGSSTAAPTGQYRHVPGGDNSSSGGSRGNSSSGGNSSSSGITDTMSSCQLQLLQLLDVAPDMIAWAKEPVELPSVCAVLRMAVDACKALCAALVGSSGFSGMASWQQQLQQQQQLIVKEQLLLLPLTLMLLPAILLPCASSLLSTSGWQHPQQRQAVQELLELSGSVAIYGGKLFAQQQSLGWLPPLPPVEWVDDVLGVVLQLVDQLVPTQAGTTGGSSSSSNDDKPALSAVARASFLVRLLPPLCSMLQCSQGRLLDSMGDSDDDDNDSSSGSGSSSSGLQDATTAASPTAATFVRLGPAFEAVLRPVTTAVQSGTLCIDDMPLVGSALFNELLVCAQGYTHSALTQHMGLCGPEVLAQEQRQLYSLLSTVLKMGRGELSAAVPCWGEQAPGSCCLAAGQAAAGLLLPPPPGSVAAAAAAQQPAADYLPSLVIFGRCCLQWAEQLQQQAPELLLLCSGALAQQEQQRREAELHEHSAALVCVAGLRSGAATPWPVDSLERLTRMVLQWVGGIEAPKALAQLEAAGCAPQQLQQRLQALLSAQKGTHKGLTDASLAALVQQLQAAGDLLSSIAVPNFCNNPACVNLSGPTEVQLVSGRSCVCAGCHIARYCGRECQRAVWKRHKPVCKALAAAKSVCGAE